MRAALLFTTTLLVACGPIYQRPAVTQAPVSEDPRAVAGERVFFRHCHSCHPQGGQGLGMGITDRPLPDFAVRLQVRNGFGEMPGFGEDEIDDDELDALLVYLNELRRLWAEEAD